MSPWYDRPGGPPRKLTADLVPPRTAMWFLRRSHTDVLAAMVEGHLTPVWSPDRSYYLFRAHEVRALRDRYRHEAKLLEKGVILTD